MKTYNKEKDILEIYAQRRYNELLKEKRVKIEEVEKGDPIKNLVEKVNAEYIKLLNTGKTTDLIPDDKMLINLMGADYTEETFNKLEKIEKTFQDKIDERDRMIQEVKAQVDLCEDREQEIAIYKMYGIMTDDGKIYDYKR